MPTRSPDVSPHVTSIADASLKELAQQTMAGLNASALAIALDVDGIMTCRARSGATAPEIGTPVQRDQGVTGECVRTGVVVRCDDTLKDPRVDAAVCEQLQIGSILVAPLLWNGQAVGIVEAFFILPNSFDDLDVDFLERVAQQIVARVWGEEASARSTITEFPRDPATDEAREQASSEASKNSDEPALFEAPAEERTAPDLAEFQSDSTDQSGSGLASKSRRRTIATVAAALVIIFLVILLYAYGHKTPVAPEVKPAPEQSAQPAAPDPLTKLRHAAEAGDADAQYKLSVAYKNGSGINADPQLANAWLRTAAEHGNADAQLDWARAHEVSDPVDAYTWYVIAGLNGKSESDDAIRQLTPKLAPSDIAQVRLDVGRQYLSGRALRRDQVAAYVWFRLSEWGGNKAARVELQNIQAQLTEKQLHQAETRASEWIRRHTAPAARNENAAADEQR